MYQLAGVTTNSLTKKTYNPLNPPEKPEARGHYFLDGDS